MDVDVEQLSTAGVTEDVLAMDEALSLLAKEDAKAAELIKLRYFAGLTIDQSAEVLGISPRTADRYWAYARAWLHDEMTNTDSGKD